MKNLTIFKLICITVVFNLIFLTGCWNYMEMDQQLNVSGIGIDKGQNGKKFHVSVEVITTGKSKDMQNTSEVIEADGNTIFDTVRGLTTTTSKRMFFGHCKILIIGEEVAKDGIAEVIDFMSRDAEARISMNVVLSKDCNARDILNSKGVDNDIIAYEIDDLIKTREKLGIKLFKIQIYSIMNVLQTIGKSLVIPTFEITKVEDYETFVSSHFGVFNKDKLIGYINPDEKKLFTIINNQLSSGIINLKLPNHDDKYLAFEIYDSRTKFKPNVKNGNLSVDVFVETDAFIGEMGTQNNYGKNSDRNAITKLLENQMKTDIEKFFDRCQNELNSDIFGFGKKIHEMEPKLWQKYKDNWDDEFRKLDINIHYKVKIKGTGVNSGTVKTI